MQLRLLGCTTLLKKFPKVEVEEDAVCSGATVYMSKPLVRDLRLDPMRFYTAFSFEKVNGGADARKEALCFIGLQYF